jgi:putative ABC transport system permease protein
MPERLAAEHSTGFSYLHWVWDNMRARPLRSALSIVAIAIQVVLILLIVGLTSGVVYEWGKRVEGVGADILVQPPNAPIFFAFSSGVMQESLAERVEKIPGVDVVAPALVLMDTRNFGLVYGIEFFRFNALSKGFLFLQGRPFEKPDEAIADDIAARTRHLAVGDHITLLNHDFVISGIVAHGKGARYFIPLRTAQDVAGADKRVSMLYVRSKGDTEKTRDAIVRIIPDHRIRSVAEYMTLMNSANLPELKPFIRTMVGLGVVISFLVVLLTMHTMVLERTREIGILKALGSSRWNILGLLLGEVLMMAGWGGLLGLVITYIVVAVLSRTSPTLTVLISSAWIGKSIALAIIGAAAGAIYPALRASRFDPVDALAYE